MTTIRFGGVAALLLAQQLTASTYDAYTTQSSHTVGIAFVAPISASFGSLGVEAHTAPPYLSYPATAEVSAGYHDSLIIFSGDKVIFKNNLSGPSGILDITYQFFQTTSDEQYGGSSGAVYATGLSSYANNNQNHFNSPGLLVKVPFFYDTPLSLDATITENAASGGGSLFLLLTALSVEEAPLVLYSDASSTQYKFTNGQFTPTPEPSAWLLGGSGLALLCLTKLGKRLDRR